MIGQVIDERFVVERQVGAGGMGVVYRARDRAHGDEPVALKVLADRTPEGARRFGRESEVLAALEHPSIVRYVAHGTLPDGHRYLVMEWIGGQPLDQRLVQTGLSLREAVSVMEQITSALAEAHHLGVVHRDLKPSNIILRDGDLERATIIDFGIARRVQEQQQLTKAGQVVGSPGYLAPEQAQGGGAIDARADVFALGCLLYECVTGRAAFAGEHLVALFVRLMVAEPEPLILYCPEAPQELEELVERTLAKDPAGRPADAAALLAELEALPIMPEGPRRQRVYEPVNTIVTSAPVEEADAEAAGSYMVLALSYEEVGASTVHTLSDASVAEIDAALQRDAEHHGARIDRFIDGSHIATVEGERAAARAAHVALLLRRHMPDAPMVVARGGDSGVADLDVNLRALERDVLRSMFLSRTAGSEDARPPGAIRLDDRAAAALGAGFDVRRDKAGAYLIPPR